MAAFVAIDVALVSVTLYPRTTDGDFVGQGVQPPTDLSSDASVSGDDNSQQSLVTDIQGRIAAANAAAEWPPDLSPPLDQLAAMAFEPQDAQGCAPASPKGKNCGAITTADPSRTLVVVGNSAAIAWLPAIRAVFGQAGWSIVALAMPACPFVDGATVSTDPTADAECTGHKEVVIRTIERLRPALVIASSFYGSAFQSNEGFANDLDHWAAAVPAMIERISPFIGNYVALSGAPRGKDPAECAVSSSPPANCRYKLPISWKTYAALEERVIPGRSRYFINTLQWFCADGQCPAFVGSTAVRRDATNMTPQYAEQLAPLLQGEMQRIGVL